MKLDSHKPLRILVFFAGNNTGGPGKGLLQLIENMPSSSAMFTVCNFRHPQQETFQFLEEAKARGIDIRLITQRWALDSGMIAQAIKIAADGSYDVVQSHGYKTHILARIVSKRMRIPWVALSHGWTRENLKIRLYNAVERYYLRHADTAIGVSPQLVEELYRLRPSRRNSLILNAIADKPLPGISVGLETRRLHGIPEDRFLVGVFGRLSPEKGQDIFIDAVSKLKDLDFTTILLGDGGQRARLEKQADDLGVRDKVHFVGYKDNVDHYFSAVNLLVLPSRNEGLPNVVLEAQHASVPVVAHDVGGVSETIVHGKTGWLVTPGDTESLAEQIRCIVTDPKAVPSIINEARGALFPKFSIATRCAAFANEYRLAAVRFSNTCNVS